ncbi:TraR/DksA C4-type zinc finger protein [candidate division KSB1 bacterium]|nr:TraR/DksA C4-type zinc finger protein [candidate division KSB1 bacterium]
MFDEKMLEYYRSLLIEIRNSILKEFENKEEGFTKSIKESSGEHSAYSFHMADIGTDSDEREKTFIVASMESDVLDDIEDALKKIQLGEFGACEQCGVQINSQRLEALPYARLCLDCKASEEYTNK